ncbi:hypothetical protein [Viridibacterium curvum]|uniref:hypothetical protein n=1 Tax=Viridibacterium curvum TaxID=1101404 RepID=UPI0031EFFBEC
MAPSQWLKINHCVVDFQPRSNINVLRIQGVTLDEVAAGLDVVTHHGGEDFIGNLDLKGDLNHANQHDHTD